MSQSWPNELSSGTIIQYHSEFLDDFRLFSVKIHHLVEIADICWPDIDKWINKHYLQKSLTHFSEKNFFHPYHPTQQINKYKIFQKLDKTLLFSISGYFWMYKSSQVEHFHFVKTPFYFSEAAKKWQNKPAAHYYLIYTHACNGNHLELKKRPNIRRTRNKGRRRRLRLPLRLTGVYYHHHNNDEIKRSRPGPSRKRISIYT